MVNQADLIKKYLAVRTAKTNLEQEHKERVRVYNEVLEKIEQIFMKIFNETGTESATARGVGTVYKSILTSVRVDDQNAFGEFVRNHDGWGLMEARASKAAVTQYLEDHQEPPPGVSITRIAKINFRK